MYSDVEGLALRALDFAFLLLFAVVVHCIRDPDPYRG